MSVVLILGSGPNVVECRDWSRDPFDRIVAINNAWAVRPDWDDLIHPEDFPKDKCPVDIAAHQRIVTAADYVPLQNTLGGFVYAGGTMAFTAAYWALASLKPRVIAMLGCDMVYPTGPNTHFYGKGEADPLRIDISLRSLEAKSARLMAIAARQNCAMVNLSKDESRLLLPRATPETLGEATISPVDQSVVKAALAEETRLNYYVPSGRYWLEEARFDTAAIDALDALWLKAVNATQTVQ
ncbi:hypothetical protein SLH49_04025 [Cognatiyoonia sp. IB215446]|uniref:hypothetical protein n=1 Tax=Cognatiyoonia sp. IB215446 TaxID=3097355 RepID=UPI002A16B461|nr:hypothetical protein [Cognatiyoonia sp. IB215446]MDX8347147.1 hypothetical protein [Cognatiyoonia sp. IB215446]